MATPTTHPGIVVAVDGSPASRVAVDWAAREAALHRFPLSIVHVIQSPGMRMWPDLPMTPELVERAARRGRAVLDAAVDTARKATVAEPIRITTETFTAGVVPTLIDLSKDSDMIVVGCRGLGRSSGGCSAR